MKNKKVEYLFHAPPSCSFFSLIIFTVSMSEHSVRLEIKKKFSLVTLIALNKNVKAMLSSKINVINAEDFAAPPINP